MNDWFVRTEVTEHEIEMPGLERRLKARRRRLEEEGAENGRVDEEIEQLRASMTATVKLRPLNAGEVAKINEIKVSADGATIPLGESRIVAVELALCGWSLDQPITRDTIRQLNPQVFQRIYDLVDIGEDADEETSPPTPPPALLALSEPEDEHEPPGPGGDSS